MQRESIQVVFAFVGRRASVCLQHFSARRVIDLFAYSFACACLFTTFLCKVRYRFVCVLVRMRVFLEFIPQEHCFQNSLVLQTVL